MNRGAGSHGSYQGDRLRQTVWNRLEALLGAFRSPAPVSLCICVRMPGFRDCADPIVQIRGDRMACDVKRDPSDL
jgi:hypothetical protein